MILIVDDDYTIRDLLKRFLEDHDFKVIASSCAQEARESLIHYPIQAMIVDVMMPDENGFDFVQSLEKKVPVLFLTACDTLDDKIKGFISGGDDYLTKPFEPLELVYRLKALIKRSIFEIRLGDYIYTEKDVYHSVTKKSLGLSSLDMKILDILIKNANHPISRSEFASLNRVDERTIDAQINRLRKKLGKDAQDMIKTIRHVGYAFMTK